MTLYTELQIAKTWENWVLKIGMIMIVIILNYNIINGVSGGGATWSSAPPSCFTIAWPMFDQLIPINRKCWGSSRRCYVNWHWNKVEKATFYSINRSSFSYNTGFLFGYGLKILLKVIYFLFLTISKAKKRYKNHNHKYSILFLIIICHIF